MSSETIYQEIIPTYLYIKQHSITGLKYFGKTTDDPYTYNGSGKYWNNHIKKHGKEHIVTLWVSNLFYDKSVVDYALHFSEENNIVESKEWANQKPENGLDGGATTNGKMWINNGVTNLYIHKSDLIPLGYKKGRLCKFNDPNFQREMSSKVDRIKQSNAMKQKWNEGTFIRDHSKCGKKGADNVSKRPAVRSKMSIVAKNRPLITCPYCTKIGITSPGMFKHHFDNCKNK